MVKLPCALVGPVTTVAVKLVPSVFISFVKTLPETILVPLAEAITNA